MMKMMNNDAFPIVKAISMACIVAALSGIDPHYANLLAAAALPTFFISAGYFFHPLPDANGKGFMTRRIGRIYLPFVRWSLIFLVLHNLLVLCAIVKGGYYGWHEFCQRGWDIVTCMSGFDETLVPTYWFFRTFFLSGLMFWIVSEVGGKAFPMYSRLKCSLLIAALCAGFMVWGICGKLSVGVLPYGGIREIYGVLLFALGYSLRLFERAGGKLVNVFSFAASALLLSLWFSFGKSSLPIFSPSQPHAGWLFAEILAGGAFFFAAAYLAALVTKVGGYPQRALSHLGRHVLYVFAFSPLAFKAAAVVVVAFSSQLWTYVALPSTANPLQGPFAIFLNFAFGIGLPLAWMAAYRKVAQRVDLSIRSRLLWTLRMLFSLIVLIFTGLKKVALYIIDTVKGLVKGFVDIIKASSPKDE